MKCCGYDMTERKDFDGMNIYWCSSCGKKIPKPLSTQERNEARRKLRIILKKRGW